MPSGHQRCRHFVSQRRQLFVCGNNTTQCAIGKPQQKRHANNHDSALKSIRIEYAFHSAHHHIGADNDHDGQQRGALRESERDGQETHAAEHHRAGVKRHGDED